MLCRVKTELGYFYIFKIVADIAGNRLTRKLYGLVTKMAESGWVGFYLVKYYCLCYVK